MSEIVQTGVARAGLPAVVPGQLSLFLDTTEQADPPIPKFKTSAGGHKTIATGVVFNTNTALQSFPVAVTATYLTNSNLNALPGSVLAVGASFRWRVALVKTAMGTGTSSLVIFGGTNGTTADTALATGILTGAGTTLADTLLVDIAMTILTAGATGTLFWSMVPVHTGAAAVGFGTPVPPLTGTTAAFNLTTANLKFGLGFLSSATGPTITVPMMQARGFGMD